MNNPLKILVWILFGICFILTFLFIFENNPGSNADTTQQTDAVLTCYAPEYNQTLTWTYSYLNYSDSIDAFKYATENGCSFRHSRYEINITGGTNEQREKN